MEFNLDKAVQVINYFTRLEEKENGTSIDKLKILKLIWLADRFHIRKYWKLIVGDTYFAMKFWPVASWIKDICDVNDSFLPTKSVVYINEYLQKYSHKIRSKKEVNLSLLSESNIEILDQVFSEFWSNPSSTLVSITHKYPEWSKFESKLKAGTITQARMNYSDFFKNFPSQDRIFDISEEHLDISKEIFEEDCKFKSLFA